MSKSARRKNRARGDKRGHRQEWGRTPVRKVRDKRDNQPDEEE